MRSVLLIAVALLLVALGLKQEQVHNQARLGPPPVEDRAQDQTVRIYSTGWSLRAREMGQRAIYKSLFVGATEYNKHNELGPGLTIIEKFHGGGVGPMRHFNVAGHIDDGIALGLFLDEVRPLSVLLIGSNTKIGPGTTQPQLYTEQLAGLFLRLDAQSEPTAVTVQSFAEICIKRKDGTFTAIAEAFSTTNGVALSYVIPGDHSELLSVTPERLRDGRRPVHFPVDEVTSDSFEFMGPMNFGQRYHDTVRATLVRDSQSNGIARASWEVATDAFGDTNARVFTSNIAMGWSANPEMLGVRFTLRLNDLWIGDRVLLREPGDAAVWRSWEESIPDIDGPIQKLTIESQWLENGEGTGEVYVSQPRLVGGQIRRL
ncbi:MAG: hypothetical protein P8N31_04610 [Planctomycetota bacterium]|nr:hypothetical protein [Planctomycetota bacterium]